MKILPTLLAAGLCLTLATPAMASEAKILTHEPVGTQITGAADQGSAPELKAGAAQDLLGVTGDDTALLYKLPEIQDGERLFVSAQLIVNPLLQNTSRENIKLSGELRRADGERCIGDSDNTRRASFERLPLITLDSDAKNSTGFARCLDQRNGELFLALQRDGAWQADTQLPVEIRVIVQPAVDPTTLSGITPETLPPASVALDAPATPVAGGSGFSNAAAVASGSVYSDSVLPFEVKYYKVHLTQGQRLNYRLSVTDSPNASAEKVHTGTYNPLLESNLMTSGAETSLNREDAGASISRSTVTTVSRDLQAGATNHELAFAGDYYITVAGTANDPRGLNPLNYELAIDVTGETSDEKTWEPAAEITEQAASASSSWLPNSAQLGALLGGVAVAIAAFAGIWFLRHRKRA